jgi:hypothetical protein
LQQTPSPWFNIAITICGVLLIPFCLLLVKLGGVLERLKSAEAATEARDKATLAREGKVDTRMDHLESAIGNVDSKVDALGLAVATIQGMLTKKGVE